MPDHVIGEHAQEDVGAHPSGETVVDRADVEVHGLQGAEGALDLGQALIGGDNGGCIERFSRDAGSQHIKTVEGRFLLDRGFVAGVSEGRIGNGQLEVLGHLALAKYGANLQADFVRAVKGERWRFTLAAIRARSASVAASSSSRLRVRSAARCLVAADDQPLAGIIRAK